MKPSIPEVLPRFRAYHRQHADWGSLHIVLADQNVGDADVRFCGADAITKGDVEGTALALILSRMSRTQRLKLGMLA